MKINKDKRKKKEKKKELKKRDSYILVYPDENVVVDSIQPIRLYLYNDGLVRLILITLHLLSSQKSFRRQCLIKILLLAQRMLDENNEIIDAKVCDAALHLRLRQSGGQDGPSH